MIKQGIRDHLIRAGKIRLGTVKGERSPGRNTDYFRFDLEDGQPTIMGPAIDEKYGVEPKTITIYFPRLFPGDATKSLAYVYDDKYQLFAGGKAICTGDGETARRRCEVDESKAAAVKDSWFKEGAQEVTCVCPALDVKNGCAPYAYLRFGIYGIPYTGFWELSTKSWAALEGLRNAITFYQQALGEEFFRTRFELFKERKQVSEQYKQWIVGLRISADDAHKLPNGWESFEAVLDEDYEESGDTEAKEKPKRTSTRKGAKATEEAATVSNQPAKEDAHADLSSQAASEVTAVGESSPEPASSQVAAASENETAATATTTTPSSSNTMTSPSKAPDLALIDEEDPHLARCIEICTMDLTEAGTVIANMPIEDASILAMLEDEDINDDEQIRYLATQRLAALEAMEDMAAAPVTGEVTPLDGAKVMLELDDAHLIEQVRVSELPEVLGELAKLGVKPRVKIEIQKRLKALSAAGKSVDAAGEAAASPPVNAGPATEPPTPAPGASAATPTAAKTTAEKLAEKKAGAVTAASSPPTEKPTTSTAAKNAASVASPPPSQASTQPASAGAAAMDASPSEKKSSSESSAAEGPAQTSANGASDTTSAATTKPAGQTTRPTTGGSSPFSGEGKFSTGSLRTLKESKVRGMMDKWSKLMAAGEVDDLIPIFTKGMTLAQLSDPELDRMTQAFVQAVKDETDPKF